MGSMLTSDNLPVMAQKHNFQETKTSQRQPGQFKHEPLQDRWSARYLVLQPASKMTDPLFCILKSAQLCEFPSYEAISYVWGIPVANQSMTCNGEVAYITANLDAALRQVRLTTRPRTLWADSICINQEDPEERGQQVALMQDIYKRSNCTLICLGASDHLHAPTAAIFVEDVHSAIQSIFEQEGFDWSAYSFPLLDSGDPLLSHSGWASFGILLQQPWFRRGWVVQEATLGQDAVVRWATTDIDWLKLVRAYVWWVRRALKLPSLQRLWLSDLHLQGFHRRQPREANALWAVKPLTILETLEHARWLDVTDPRDRIYAFLGLLNPNNNNKTLYHSVQPNYKVSHSHVYRDFAVEYLRKHEDLDILHFVHNDASILESEVASWVPRWNLRLYSSYTGSLHNYNITYSRFISRVAPSHIAVSADKATLGLRLMILDTVTFTGQVFSKNSTTIDDVTSIWESVSMQPVPMLYACSTLRAFVEVFRCGMYRGRLSEWITLESAFMRMLQRDVIEGTALHDDAKSFHRQRMEDVHNRCFFVSSRGYYGLAPKIVQEGDLCCIIFGTRSPFIVRKTGPPGFYKLVGSVLIISKELDHNGYPVRLSDATQDWVGWGLTEEDGFIC